MIISSLLHQNSFLKNRNSFLVINHNLIAKKEKKSSSLKMDSCIYQRSPFSEYLYSIKIALYSIVLKKKPYFLKFKISFIYEIMLIYLFIMLFTGQRRRDRD